MPLQARKRSGSRERILDAAAELVRELGAARLTLDAVAERAGLSKGGLLYNFPTKDALLQGMLERIIEVARVEKQSLSREYTGQRNVEARSHIETALRIREHIKGIAIGIIAASAENPKLLDPVRTAIAENWKELKHSEDPDAAAIAWLAIEGLGSLEMHDLSPLTKSDREMVIAAIRRSLERSSPDKA
jgi:AcrR family transcriptional regulator